MGERVCRGRMRGSMVHVSTRILSPLCECIRQCRRDKIFQMAPGEILRHINLDNGASDLRRLAKKSVSCPQHSQHPRVLRGDISLLENVTESTAMHIQRNRTLMKGADCSWNAKCTPLRMKPRLIGKRDTRAVLDDCSVTFNSFYHEYHIVAEKSLLGTISYSIFYIHSFMNSLNFS